MWGLHGYGFAAHWSYWLQAAGHFWHLWTMMLHLFLTK